MNIQSELKNIIEKAVKQAIDELAIKEQIRDYVASAITKEEIVKKTGSLIDSYFRSAMNCQSVENYIQKRMEELVKESIQKSIDKVIDGTNRWRGAELLKAEIERQMRAQLSCAYDISISIKEKGEQ